MTNGGPLKHRHTFSAEVADSDFNEFTHHSDTNSLDSVPPSSSSPSKHRGFNAHPYSLGNAGNSSNERHPRLTKATSTISINDRPNMSNSILPRVGGGSGYKRVDGGQAPGRLRFGWKKFAVGAVVVIGLVWIFGPRERRESVLELGSGVVPASWKKPIKPEKVYDDDTLLPVTKKPSSSPSTPSRPLNAPHSPEDDPDLTKTVYCTHPFSDDARLVQYALMIDAGSTGSRIHIYKFNNCGPSPAYEYEVFKMTQPGLSSYKSDAEGAAASLDVLLDEAVRVVPESLRSCTPVAVKATAGLRLLGASESEAILAAVRGRLSQRYPFSVVERDGVVIMDGKDEGVYAWITANYLLGAIGSQSDDESARPPSYAVLDLGGASTQIVFEPEFAEPDGAFADGEHKYELQFGGQTYVLYQHSYLGYGLMRARQSVHRLVEFMASFSSPISGPPAGYDEDEDGAPVNSFVQEIANPCLARGTRRMVKLDAMLPGELARQVNMVGSDVGSFEGCNRVVELVMAKDAICQVKPCAFNGVYQPSILDTFSKGNILLLSYFYDRIAPFYPSLSLSSSSQDQPDLNISTLATLASDVCRGRIHWTALWGDAQPELIAELEDRPEWCLDLTFMHALLRLGYEFGDARSVRVGKQVEGTELGWCLGATIAIVGGDLSCRI